MPITSTHPKYDEWMKVWARCRHVSAGEDMVKRHARAQNYLPQLEGQRPDEYEGYLTRAMFYNATGRTIQAIVGAIFRKPLVIEPDPGEGEQGTDRADTLTDVARCVAEELFEVGRVGLLADFSKDGTGEPYLIDYKAEQITNWRYEMVGDEQKLTLVVLHEQVWEPDPDDPYQLKEVERYRELVLEGGVYRQRLHVKEETGEGSSRKIDWVVKEDTTPMALGQTMDSLPFIIVGQTGIDADIHYPPLLDMVNVNLSHFRTSADLEHGRHFTALPTAWVAGFDSKSDLKIGSGTAWVTENTAARAGFLEFSGAGLGSLERALEQKEHLMAVLGARLFEPPKSQVEAAETVRLRQSAETSTAANMARVIGAAMTKAYRYLLGFVRNAAIDSAKVEVPSDVLDLPMEMADLTAMVAAWQAGAISYDTLLWNLKQGEVLPPDREIEDEKALVQNDDVRFMREERASELKMQETEAAAAAKPKPTGGKR